MLNFLPENFDSLSPLEQVAAMKEAATKQAAAHEAEKAAAYKEGLNTKKPKTAPAPKRVFDRSMELTVEINFYQADHLVAFREVIQRAAVWSVRNAQEQGIAGKLGNSKKGIVCLSLCRQIDKVLATLPNGDVQNEKQLGRENHGQREGKPAATSHAFRVTQAISHLQKEAPDFLAKLPSLYDGQEFYYGSVDDVMNADCRDAVEAVKHDIEALRAKEAAEAAIIEAAAAEHHDDDDDDDDDDDTLNNA